MDDLISRQAAIDIAYPFDNNERDLIDALEELPTADVVEVVRCKDCKYWDNDEYFTETVCTRCGNDFYEQAHTRHYDFCSYGERKDT